MTALSPKKSTPFNLRRLLKIFATLCVVLLLLLVVGYFVVTSSGFFKGVILPKVSVAAGADVTVSDASIHPFSGVTLTDLKVQVKGEEPVLIAKEVHAKYSLWSIIRGNIVVSDVAVVSPVISVVTKADGTRNLPQSASDSTSKNMETSASESKPLHVDIKKVAITDATIRNTQQFKDGKSNIAEITGFNFSIENIKNGQTAKIAINFDAAVANTEANMAGLMNASSTGNFSIAFTDDLKPASVSGNLALNISRATGTMAELAGVGVSFKSEINMTEIKQLGVGFLRNGVTLGEIRASGPFDLNKAEGRLNVEVSSIDRRVLNIAGAMTGIDFGTTTINSTNRVDISAGGKMVSASGRFNLNQFQVTRANQTTPTLDLNASYDVSVDLNAKAGTLHLLNVVGDQNRTPLLRANLSNPMALAWGETGGNMGDSTLNVDLTTLNLADWKPFIGDAVSSGIVNANVKILSQQGGKALTISLKSGIDNLAAKAGANAISDANIEFTTQLQAKNFNLIQLENYQLQVARLKQTLLSVSGSGSYDVTAKSADIQIGVDASPVNLLAAFPQPGVSVQSGSVQLKAHLLQNGTKQTVTGNFVLADFTGKSGAKEFRSFGTDVKFDLAVDGPLVQLNQIGGKLNQAGNNGGGFDVSGQYDTASGSGKFDLKLDGLNENAVRPFLQPMLADKKLVSVNINGTATAQYDPKGSSSVRADFQMANLKVNDPTGQVPSTALEAGLKLDTSLDRQIADVRQLQIKLTPTVRGKNEINLSGRVDMTKTNVFQGGLKLAADSLDLTTYYDLFAGQTNAATTAQTTSSPATAQPETEPAAMTLPFQNFLVEANIGKIYLREVEISDFKTSLKLDSDRVELKPFALSLNNAPVTAIADVNVGVPGYKYDVSFDANKVPLTPLVNTFVPERKRQIGGTAIAQGHVLGAGVTGANLQKNLNGQFDISATNMNLALINVHSPILRVLINTIAGIPELIKNPTSALTGIVGGVLGGRTDAGFAGKLSSAPLDSIEIHGNAGNGVINLQKTIVQSRAFLAEAPGTVSLAAVLNDSKLNLPVTVSLERSLGQQINVTSSDPNARYSAMPRFLTITGTVGTPRPDIDKLALVEIGAKTGLGIVNAIQGGGGKTNSPSGQNTGQQLINEGVNVLKEGINIFKRN